MFKCRPNALICFAGPRVIEQTSAKPCPKGSARRILVGSRYAGSRDTAHKIAQELITIVRMLMKKSPAIKGDLPAPPRNLVTPCLTRKVSIHDNPNI